ncbi:MAG: substrate-binding domain-containing protein [Oscillospiraceae bacterium]|nr:substrate-binding domain-containing protein [Oscillospiraceae bacterium]
MKKPVIIALLLVIVLSMASCGGSAATTTTAAPPQETTTAATTAQTQAAPPAAEKMKIGVSLPTQREERWVLDREAFERVGTELDVDVLIQIADNDAGRQQSQCENLISQGIQALVIAPHDADAAANIAELAHAANIPIISYDRLVQNADVDLYVTFDQYRIGQIMGEYVARNVDKGNIVVLSGDPADPTCVPLKQGAVDAIQPKVDSGDYTIVMEQECRDWEPREALRHAENALTANNNEIAAFIAPNDGTAGGIIQALAAQGLDGKVVVTGQDAEEDAVARIIEGTQSMTVYFNCAEMAEATLRAAVKMVNGESSGANSTENNGKIDVPTLGFPPYELNKDNYSDFGF